MTNVIAAPTFRPLYDQIKILLTQSLVAGEWKPGEAIPSEVDLAARFGVSQGTVRKAIDELATENILVRRQGKGTFVASHVEDHARFRFLRIHSDTGHTIYPKSEFLACKRDKASPTVAKALELRPGAPVHLIHRRLIFSGKPLVFDEIVVPAALCKGLTGTQLNEYSGSLYSFFESRYGLRMIRAEERLTAVAADEKAAAILEVPVAAPLLAVHRIAYTYGDKPVEWRRGLCHTEGYSYVNELG